MLSQIYLNPSISKSLNNRKIIFLCGFSSVSFLFIILFINSYLETNSFDKTMIEKITSVLKINNTLTLENQNRQPLSSNQKNQSEIDFSESFKNNSNSSTFNNFKKEEKDVTSISLFDRYFVNEIKPQSAKKSITPRTFNIRKKEFPYPCYQNEYKQVEYNTKSKMFKGNIYIKVPKCASTTLAGIALRMGHHHKTNMNETNPCATNFDHRKLHQFTNIKKRTKKDSFLWSFIRNPTSLKVSKFFYFHVSRHNNTPTDKAFIERSGSNKMAKYLSRQPRSIDQIYGKNKRIQNIPKLYNTVKNILNDYDFIGVVERFDESLVLFKLLFGLEARDILYVSSKTSGNFNTKIESNKCWKITPSFISPAMKKDLTSNKHYSKNAADFMLYKAVNRKLDDTIKKVGLDTFNKALKEHVYLMSLVKEKCEPYTIFPCSSNGTKQKTLAKLNCYVSDIGCGYPCLDNLLKNTSYFEK